jgi:lipocalin
MSKKNNEARFLRYMAIFFLVSLNFMAFQNCSNQNPAEMSTERGVASVEQNEQSSELRNKYFPNYPTPY